MKIKLYVSAILICIFSVGFSTVKYHQYPTISPRSKEFSVKVNDKDVLAYYTTAGSFVSFEADESVILEIFSKDIVKSVEIKPIRLNIKPEFERHIVRFQLPAETKVMVEIIALQANLGGQAFEIGHELVQDPITNIRYIDCDVLGVHGQGGVFGVHNSDAAIVSDVLYENIRVDHCYNKLVDLRVIKSRWTDQEEPGHLKNVTFRNIDVRVSIYNPGYSISLIGGYDEDHKVKNVTFENFRMNGKKIVNADQMDLYVKQAENITFQ